jgi:hypothetical protein
MSAEEDLALETLLSVRAQNSSQVDEHLLRQCYSIQKRHQFSRDRTYSTNAMDRLIAEAVEILTSKAAQGGDS